MTLELPSLEEIEQMER